MCEWLIYLQSARLGFEPCEAYCVEQRWPGNADDLAILGPLEGECSRLSVDRVDRVNLGRCRRPHG